MAPRRQGALGSRCRPPRGPGDVAVGSPRRGCVRRVEPHVDGLGTPSIRDVITKALDDQIPVLFEAVCEWTVRSPQQIRQRSLEHGSRHTMWHWRRRPPSHPLLQAPSPTAQHHRSAAFDGSGRHLDAGAGFAASVGALCPPSIRPARNRQHGRTPWMQTAAKDRAPIRRVERMRVDPARIAAAAIE